MTSSLAGGTLTPQEAWWLEEVSKLPKLPEVTHNLVTELQAKQKGKGKGLCSNKTLAFTLKRKTDDDTWTNAVKERAVALGTRGVFADALIHLGLNLGEHDLCKPCCQYAVTFQHSDTKEEKRVPLPCQERGICPVCGTQYGLERGAERYSTLKALFEPGQLLDKEPFVKTLNFEFTFPAWISHLLIDCHLPEDYANLVKHRQEMQAIKQQQKQGYKVMKPETPKKEFSLALTQVSKAVEKTLEQVFGKGLGLFVDAHFWHSKDSRAKARKQERDYIPFKPLTGSHFHLHVTVPNICIIEGAARGPVIENAKINAKQLEQLKSTFAREVRKCAFVRDYASGLDMPLEELVPDELNMRYQFSSKWEQVRHRARYCCRHPMQDVLAEKRVLPIETPGIDWFLLTSQAFQTMQTTRRYGWVSNAALSKLGISELKSETPGQWEKKADSTVWMYPQSFNKDGGYFSYWKDGIFFSSVFVARSQVQLLPKPSPRSYGWKATAPPHCTVQTP
jgi:hypothetical protein